MDDSTYAERRSEPGPPLPELVRLVTDAIAQVRARGAHRLLIDLRALAGATPPSLAQRDALVTAGARAAGLRAEGFEEVEAARAWLVRQPLALAGLSP